MLNCLLLDDLFILSVTLMHNIDIFDLCKGLLAVYIMFNYINVFLTVILGLCFFFLEVFFFFLIFMFFIASFLEGNTRMFHFSAKVEWPKIELATTSRTRTW